MLIFTAIVFLIKADFILCLKLQSNYQLTTNTFHEVVFPVSLDGRHEDRVRTDPLTARKVGHRTPASACPTPRAHSVSQPGAQEGKAVPWEHHPTPDRSPLLPNPLCRDLQGSHKGNHSDQDQVGRGAGRPSRSGRMENFPESWLGEGEGAEREGVGLC